MAFIAPTCSNWRRRIPWTSHSKPRSLHCLSDKVDELSQLVAQNAQLDDKVRRAAARTTALNERFLRRIAADLHDGPGQDLALALMRFDTITGAGTACPASGDRRRDAEGFRAIHTALQAALTDLRTISLGLQLPEIEQLRSCEISQRAVRDFERKTGATVVLTMVNAPADIPLPEKTIKHYVANILQKLQVRSRVEAALLAAQYEHPKP